MELGHVDNQSLALHDKYIVVNDERSTKIHQ